MEDVASASYSSSSPSIQKHLKSSASAPSVPHQGTPSSRGSKGSGNDSNKGIVIGSFKERLKKIRESRSTKSSSKISPSFKAKGNSSQKKVNLKEPQSSSSFSSPPIVTSPVTATLSALSTVPVAAAATERSPSSSPTQRLTKSSPAKKPKGVAASNSHTNTEPSIEMSPSSSPTQRLTKSSPIGKSKGVIAASSSDTKIEPLISEPPFESDVSSQAKVEDTSADKISLDDDTPPSPPDIPPPPPPDLPPPDLPLPDTSSLPGSTYENDNDTAEEQTMKTKLAHLSPGSHASMRTRLRTEAWKRKSDVLEGTMSEPLPPLFVETRSTEVKRNESVKDLSGSSSDSIPDHPPPTVPETPPPLLPEDQEPDEEIGVLEMSVSFPENKIPPQITDSSRPISHVDEQLVSDSHLPAIPDFFPPTLTESSPHSVPGSTPPTNAELPPTTPPDHVVTPPVLPESFLPNLESVTHTHPDSLSHSSMADSGSISPTSALPEDPPPPDLPSSPLPDLTLETQPISSMLSSPVGTLTETSTPNSQSSSHVENLTRTSTPNSQTSNHISSTSQLANTSPIFENTPPNVSIHLTSSRGGSPIIRSPSQSSGIPSSNTGRKYDKGLNALEDDLRASSAPNLEPNLSVTSHVQTSGSPGDDGVKLQMSKEKVHSSQYRQSLPNPLENHSNIKIISQGSPPVSPDLKFTRVAKQTWKKSKVIGDDLSTSASTGDMRGSITGISEPVEFKTSSLHSFDSNDSFTYERGNFQQKYHKTSTISPLAAMGKSLPINVIDPGSSDKAQESLEVSNQSPPETASSESASREQHLKLPGPLKRGQLDVVRNTGMARRSPMSSFVLDSNLLDVSHACIHLLVKHELCKV